MPVRYDDEDPAIATAAKPPQTPAAGEVGSINPVPGAGGDQRPGPPAGPRAAQTKPGPRRRPRWRRTGPPAGNQKPSQRPPRWLMGVIPLVALVAVSVVAIATRADRHREPTPTTTTVSVTTSTAAGAPGTELPRGDAVFGGGGTAQLHGVPIGYEQTRVGGIQAALNYEAASVGLPIWNGWFRAPINQHIFTDTARSAAVSDEIVAKVQAEYSFDALGRPLNPDGTVNERMKLYAAYLGRYGAYRVLNITPDTERPTSITVETWGPRIFGVGSREDLSRVHVRWSSAITTVSWVNGDWRISDSDYPTTTPPAPKNSRKVNASFAERARLLGNGWLIPANASEDPDPTLELARL